MPRLSPLGRLTISLVAIGFSFVLLADAERLPVRATQTLRAHESVALWPAVAQAKVIYVGETHDKAMNHAYELRLVRGMIRRRIGFAIGWEMFDYTQQALLDAWDRGAISLQQLFRGTGFDRRHRARRPRALRLPDRPGI